MNRAVDADGLTSQWLSQALDCGVCVLSRERIGTGQTAATYRLRIDGGGWPTIIAKVAAGGDAARTRVRGGFRAEVGFYARLRPELDVRAPRCFYAAISGDALRFTLLLEDLAPRVPGVQACGCPPGPARDAVRNLAGLHAPLWNDHALLGLDFLPKPSTGRAAFIGGLALAATDMFIERYRGELPTADVGTLRAAAVATEQWLLPRDEPFSLLHGDYRLDNLMFEPEGHDVVAVDWQTITLGPPARDLAYFLGTCLPVSHRRAAEEELVGCYHEQLVARGVQGYPLERCFGDYRLGQLQGPMITTIGAVHATGARTPASDAMFLAMARRSCAAIRDLGSLDLL
jgi:hypothetical protein